jgi:hypothetical protein
MRSAMSLARCASKGTCIRTLSSMPTMEIMARTPPHPPPNPPAVHCGIDSPSSTSLVPLGAAMPSAGRQGERNGGPSDRGGRTLRIRYARSYQIDADRRRWAGSASVVGTNHGDTCRGVLRSTRAGGCAASRGMICRVRLAIRVFDGRHLGAFGVILGRAKSRHAGGGLSVPRRRRRSRKAIRRRCGDGRVAPIAAVGGAPASARW